MSAAPTFSPRAALGLVAVGSVAFLVLLYAIGAGLTGGGNNGGAHALSKGLSGYAGLATLLENTGTTVVRARDPAALDEPGLLVLTPPHDADGADVARIVEARRRIGPTLIVLPKWIEVPARGNGAKAGWVALAGTSRARWVGSLAEGLDVELRPRAAQSLAIAKDAAIPLVRDENAKAQVAYLNDDGSYPALDEWSGWDPPNKPDEGLFPMAIVAEPDLLSNRGMADRATALEALALLRKVKAEADRPVIFDVTLNGLGRAREAYADFALADLRGG